LDAALGESLRREDVLDVLLRKGIARRERVAVVQIPRSIQQEALVPFAADQSVFCI
jgi:hypothetical protein